MRLKIGLVGEDPNDTLSIRSLLSGKYPDVFHFKQLIRNKRGHQLDNTRTDAALKIEFEEFKPDYVLFIRDADALPSEYEKLEKVRKWFEKMNNVVGKRGILLINIFELEALILADIESFNKIYGTTIQFSRNCMYQKQPKEFLIQKTAQNRRVYTESDCPSIFENLKYDVIVANCQYFRDFDRNHIKILITK